MDMPPFVLHFSSFPHANHLAYAKCHFLKLKEIPFLAGPPERKLPFPRNVAVPPSGFRQEGSFFISPNLGATLYPKPYTLYPIPQTLNPLPIPKSNP